MTSVRIPVSVREKDEIAANPPCSFPKNSNYRHYVFGWPLRLTYRLSTGEQGGSLKVKRLQGRRRCSELRESPCSFVSVFKKEEFSSYYNVDLQ